MSANQPEQPLPIEIAQHYEKTVLEREIQSALEKAGKSWSQITLEDLAALDELHIGGKAATRALANQSNLSPGSLVLDIGSGLGGPARTLATEVGYTVVGLDITESFCRLSRKLTNAVALPESTNFVCGNGLELPFAEETFDGIWSQHCSMNISNKAQLYSEYHRVLNHGGHLLIHDVIFGDDRLPLFYPVPWAHDPSLSFLVTEATMRSQLEEAGFSEVLYRNISDNALAWFDQQKDNSSKRKRSIFNQKMVYGDNLLSMVKNMKTNLLEGRMRVIEVILSR